MLGAWTLAIVAVVSTIVRAAVPYAQFEHYYAHSSLTFPAVPALLVYLSARKHREQAARSWRWIGLGIAGYFLYDCLWYFGWLTHTEVVTPIADFANLFFAPTVLAGTLLSTATPRDPADRLRTRIDASITFVTAVVLVLGVIGAAGGRLRSVNSIDDVITVAQPFIDLVTIGGLAILWVRRDYAEVPTWGVWFGLALSLGLIADFWYVLPQSVGRPSEWFVVGAWYGTWACIGFGGAFALRDNTRLPAAVVPTTRLPYLMVVICYLALITAIVVSSTVLIVMTTVAVGIVTLLVLLRQTVGAAQLARLHLERANARADGRLAAMVRHGTDLLTVVDADGVVRFASPSYQSVMGVEPTSLVGKNLFHTVHRDDLAQAQAVFRALIAGEEHRVSLLARFQHTDGSWRWVEGHGTDLRQEPSVGGIVLNSRDVTERKAMEARLLDQAFRDPLTGLANRRLFRDRVAHALERHRRHPGAVAVLFLDLDHFKFVNDTLGHAVGDALLIAVAGRLQTAVRSADTVARLGGDEFALLLEDLQSPTEAELTAQRVQHAFERPVHLAGRDVLVRTSIGIAWATDGQDVDELLSDADVAMYGAKNAGRGRTERFSGEMRAAVVERLGLEVDLRRAIDRHELFLVYQPIIDLRTGAIRGAEALVRWAHPERGVLLPGLFIPIAEESDLIVEMGRVIIDEVCRDAAWLRTTCTAAHSMRLGANVSARQLVASDLVHDVSTSMAAHGISGSQLLVELTETTFASNAAHVTARLDGLRALGLQVALDDFGTGYSSLSYLRQFPIDLLKIDKSFLSDSNSAVEHDGVTRAIISIGQSLGMRTVAEGVESLSQLARLSTMGCSSAQGYFISRPLDREALAAFVRGWDADGLLEQLAVAEQAEIALASS